MMGLSRRKRPRLSKNELRVQGGSSSDPIRAEFLKMNPQGLFIHPKALARAVVVGLRLFHHQEAQFISKGALFLFFPKERGLF